MDPSVINTQTDIPMKLLLLHLALYRGTKVEQLRPYLQGFWHTPEDVRLNIKAAEDMGLDWIIWNNSSVYDANYFTKIES